MDNEDKD